jgi:hypothetical protein
MERVIRVATLILVELGILYGDVILAIGFSVFNNRPVPWMENLSLLIMCICDPVSFLLSWFKPKAAGLLLAITSVITVGLSVAASDPHSSSQAGINGLMRCTCPRAASA